MPQVVIEFYAILRQQAGVPACTLETEAVRVGDLYAELCARHGFTLAPAQVRAAVNDAFVPWTHPLKNGDRVVFIPPVAGG